MAHCVVKVIAETQARRYYCGTGVFVSGDNDVLTSAHVIDSSNVWIYHNGAIFTATETFRDNMLDVCILKVNKEGTSQYALLHRHCMQGQQCYAIGYPHDSNNSSCKVGAILAKSETSSELFDYMAVSILPERGMSGSPVFNLDDKIVGMISWNTSSMSGCASFECICTAVERHLNGEPHVANTCNIQTSTLSAVDVISNDLKRLFNRVHGAVVLSSKHRAIKERDIVLAIDGCQVDGEHSVDKLCYDKKDAATFSILVYNQRLHTYDAIRRVVIPLTEMKSTTSFKSYTTA